MSNSNSKKLIYYIGTGILTGIMCFSIFNYFFNHEMIEGFFIKLGYPVYLIYPLAVAKILGLTVVWTNYSSTLKEWAYAGFFFDIGLAYTAHIKAGDNGLFACIAFIGLALSYYGWKTQRS